LKEANSGIAKEKNEIFMIVKSNAISNPRTMMIHSIHTFVALPTMMSSWNFDLITSETISQFSQ